METDHAGIHAHIHATHKMRERVFDNKSRDNLHAGCFTRQIQMKPPTHIINLTAGMENMFTVQYNTHTCKLNVQYRYGMYCNCLCIICTYVCTYLCMYVGPTVHTLVEVLLYTH